MSKNKCKKCGHRMVIDNLATAQSYNKDTGKIVDKNGDITVANTPDYVILKCMFCGTFVKKSFDELVTDFKTSFVQALLDIRKLSSNTKLGKVIFREESGMSYCGYCAGPFDGDGYCLNDKKAHCVVRKLCIDREKWDNLTY